MEGEGRVLKATVLLDAGGAFAVCLSCAGELLSCGHGWLLAGASA